MKKKANYGIQAIIILSVAFYVLSLLQDPFCK